MADVHTPTEQQKLHVLRHSLGLREDGSGRAFRNHFVTGEGSDDYPICSALVADGLMTRRKGGPLSGGDDIFHVTDAGRAKATGGAARATEGGV